MLPTPARMMAAEPETAPVPQVQAAMESLNLAIDGERGLRAAVKHLYACLEPILNRTESADPCRSAHGYDAPLAHAIDLNTLAIEEITSLVSQIIRKVQV